MNTVYKDEQVYALSNKLGISQTDVKRVIDTYISRLVENLDSGETVKFLNICYLTNSIMSSYSETLAYTSNEIAKYLKLGKEVVLRVLLSFEDLIVLDLKKFYSYSIRGLVRISYEEYKENVYKVRIISSSKYANKGIRVVTLNSFRRKVEGYDRKDP